MQKLPEVSDRKKERRMHKEKGTSRQEEKVHSLSGSDCRSENTLLNWWKTPRIRFWTKRWLVLSLVAVLSVNSILKWNYELKQWTSTNLQKRLTIVEAIKYQMRTNIY